MQLKLYRRAVFVLATLLAAAPGFTCTAAALPQGVTVQTSADGLVLAADGKPLYRIDLDRMAKRRRGNAGLGEARWAAFNGGLWRPVAAPKDFKGDDDWSVTPRPTGPQLTYKGDPLYSFAGKSLAEADEAQVAPPYFSSYAAKPTLIANGVAVATLYYHPALYEPPAPKVVAPSGVTAQWAKATYVFADSDKHALYTAKAARACASGCDGLKPFAAPLAALPVGEWRPVEDKGGARVWAYRGRIVYQAQAADVAEPGGDWSRLEVR